MKLVHLLFYSFFAITFLGCATNYPISFNSDKSYQSKIKRALIEVKNDQLGYFFKSFGDSLFVELERQGVIVKSIDTGILSIDSEKDSQNFNPQVIIQIERTLTNQSVNKTVISYSGGVYLMSIILPDTHKIVWKASINTNSEFYASKSSAKLCVQKIIQQLQMDQLL